MSEIAVFDAKTWQDKSLLDYLKKSLSSKLKNTKIKIFDNPINSYDLKKLKDIETIAIFINSEINKKILDSLPKLKLITTMSTGFDHINLKECNKKSIIVSNVPSYGDNSVAEHTFALLTIISKNLYESINKTRNSDYTDNLTGFELKDKTIGIVGTGRIGISVVKIAKALGMNVIANDAFPRNELQSELGFTYKDLNALFKESDIITLHVPLLPSTKHLINKDAVNKMKKSVVLINTSRGEVIDNKALLYGLEKGIISKAGLDVIENEELLKNKEFNSEKGETLKKIISMKNVYLTPHNAFNTKEAIKRIFDTTIENILAYHKEKPTNVIKQ